MVRETRGEKQKESWQLAVGSWQLKTFTALSLVLLVY